MAQYGRASGLIEAISGQIISDFARNLEAEIGADTAAPSGSADDPSGEVQPDAAPDAAPAAALSDNSISGIGLFFRAIWAMIRGKLQREKAP